MDTKNLYYAPLDKKYIRQVITTEAPMHKKHKRHDFTQAIDFSCDEGTPILAALDGEVYFAVDNSAKSGNYITIEHENEELSHYHHLRNNGVLVEAGQEVKVREVIGYSGSTGKATYPHLHFMVIRWIDSFAYESLKVRWANGETF